MARILCVDDEQAILVAFDSYLDSSDYELDLAGDLETATSLLQERHYDAIITDLRLSSGNKTEGLEVIRLARERLPNAKVMLLTGYGSPQVEAQAVALGVDCYMQKPISLAELEKVLRSLLMLPPSDSD